MQQLRSTNIYIRFSNCRRTWDLQKHIFDKAPGNRVRSLNAHLQRPVEEVAKQQVQKKKKKKPRELNNVGATDLSILATLALSYPPTT
jgi:hypothetical protein